MSIELLFVEASKKKYRYNSVVGVLVTEDLWGLPLTSKTKANLEDVAITLHNQMQTREVSFVSKAAEDPTLRNKLEIVKYVIACRESDVAARKNAAERAAFLEVIEEAIKDKKNDSIRNMSLE